MIKVNIIYPVALLESMRMHLHLTQEAKDQLLEKLKGQPVKFENNNIGAVERVNEDGTIDICITDQEIISLISAQSGNTSFGIKVQYTKIGD